MTIIKNSFMALGVFGILTTSVQAAYFDYAPAPRCEIAINRTLQVGSEGVDVSVLQDFLNRAGFLSAIPNGHYGPATKTAVRAFQANNGIAATGSVGPMTLNAINERMCDTDLRADSFTSYDTYGTYGYAGQATGVTYVDPVDPFVRVVSPRVSAPNVYTNPQNVVLTPSYNSYGSTLSNPVTTSVSSYGIAPATVTGAASTNIVYSPTIGYTYGITPATGSLSISTPVANTLYNEGDTVTVAWTANNINANGYTILLENTSTGQSKAVTTTSGTSASFTLTKDLLDAVCSVGSCSGTYGNTSTSNYEGAYRIVVTTPIRDIAGNVSTFRAAVSPITIKRPYANFGTVSITASKTPVNSGELFKLYVNIPTGSSWNTNLYGQYSFKIKAICPTGVTVSIAGVVCGQEFSLPYAPTYFQSEIPATIGNSTWYQQNVTFVMTVTNLQGQIIGTAQTNVTVNQAPFSW
jgi:peptidoglycan hydrolase-like protein with peptidoglycan-binding domain